VSGPRRRPAGESLHVRPLQPGSCRRAAADGGPERGAQVKHKYDESGDLGVVAFNARATQRTMFPTKPLTVAGVFSCARGAPVPCMAAPCPCGLLWLLRILRQ